MDNFGRIDLSGLLKVTAGYGEKGMHVSCRALEAWILPRLVSSETYSCSSIKLYVLEICLIQLNDTHML